MKLTQLVRTLKDIPPQQLLTRLSHELENRIMQRLPVTWREALLGCGPTPPIHTHYLDALLISAESVQPRSAFQKRFCFLNNEKILSSPLRWNDRSYSRLWQFHLHYFDYFRDDLNESYLTPSVTESHARTMLSLVQDWQAYNPYFSFDGWHPYTTSLRLINWTYALKAFPGLATPQTLESLWKKLCYLNTHTETFAGGNHLLENLRALVITGLLFDSPKAESIVTNALQKLARQLDLQILEDGGHYEYSTSYHLVMTQALAETIACLQSANKSVPPLFTESLSKMVQFALGMRLSSGLYPLWNDAAYNSAPPLDNVVTFASRLLELALPEGINTHLEPLEEKLLVAAKLESNVATSIPTPRKESQITFTALGASGYYLLRNAEGLEVAFDVAPPCPKALPGHAHADCLSVDVYFKGEPIFVETGTSRYAGGDVRHHERSTLAHNTVTINNQSQSEMWGSFRVGRKAQPKNVQHGLKDAGQQTGAWVSGTHDGYDLHPFYAHHQRCVTVSDKTLIILDVLQSREPVPYLSRFHIAPEVALKGLARDSHEVLPFEVVTATQNLYLYILGLGSDSCEVLSAEQGGSWYAPEMGKRISRGVLNIAGTVTTEAKALCVVLSSEALEPRFAWSGKTGQLHFAEATLTWQQSEDGLRLNEPT